MEQPKEPGTWAHFMDLSSRVVMVNPEHVIFVRADHAPGQCWLATAAEQLGVMCTAGEAVQALEAARARRRAYAVSTPFSTRIVPCGADAPR